MRGSEDIEARIAKARRGTVGSSANEGVQRAAGEFLKRYIEPMRNEIMQMKERLEVLAGIRGDRSQHALRLKDVQHIRGIKLRSEIVTAAPTAEQHNALVKDLREVIQALENVK